jgi:predicted nucleic acid-binding protein
VRLVVDTNIVLAELLRERGRRLIGQPVLQLFMSEAAWDETNYELPRRLERWRRQRNAPEEQARHWLRLIAALLVAHIQPISHTVYAIWEEEARLRIPRDPDDWPTVAVALALDTGIWTEDHDFLGCGVPVWTTETLAAHLRRATSEPGAE